MAGILNKDVASCCRGLSSGTMSKLIRDEWFWKMKKIRESRFDQPCGLCLNPLKSADLWHIERVQFALSRFAELNHGRFFSWQECWREYLKQLGRVKFKCCYSGSEWFTVSGHGDAVFQTYYLASVHLRATYRGTMEDFEKRIVGLLGRIRLDVSDGTVPDDVAVLFPLYSPGHYDYGHGCYFRTNPEWPEVKLGETADGGICVWTMDARFDPSPEDWDNWNPKIKAMGAGEKG